jgi:hypothetical protein
LKVTLTFTGAEVEIVSRYLAVVRAEHAWRGKWNTPSRILRRALDRFMRAELAKASEPRDVAPANGSSHSPAAIAAGKPAKPRGSTVVRQRSAGRSPVRARAGSPANSRRGGAR